MKDRKHPGKRPLEGRTAIVTGASRGIGRAVALRLGKMGAAVAVNYAERTEAAEETAAGIRKAGSAARVVRADMRRVAEIEALFDRTLETFGSLDILVNNAGIPLYKPVAEVEEAELDNILAVNVKGVFFACREAARKMADGGRIVNISSSVTRLMIPTYAPYAASKGAVEQITRVLAKELGGRRITVNAVAPGPTDTELFRGGKTREQIESMARSTALGRIGTPEDVADAVAFLAGPDGGWVTGQTLCANGGFAA